jgi:hypothetical protein
MAALAKGRDAMTRSPAELGIDLMSGGFFGNDPYPASGSER